jgi:hypothetical protein
MRVLRTDSERATWPDYARSERGALSLTVTFPPRTAIVQRILQEILARSELSYAPCLARGGCMNDLGCSNARIYAIPPSRQAAFISRLRHFPQKVEQTRAVAPSARHSQHRLLIAADLVMPRTSNHLALPSSRSRPFCMAAACARAQQQRTAALPATSLPRRENRDSVAPASRRPLPFTDSAKVPLLPRSLASCVCVCYS